MKPGILKTAALLTACLYALPLAGCTTANRAGRQPNTGIRRQNINGTNPKGIGTRLYDGNNVLPGTTPGTGRLNNMLPGTTPGTGLINNKTPGNGLLPNNSGLNGNTSLIGNNSITGSNRNDRVRADRIRNGLAGTKDLGRVNVLTHGDNAIIGIEKAKTKAGKDVNHLRDTVVKKVRQLDPGIKSIYISDKRDVSDEIKRLYNNVVPDKAGNRLKNDVQKLMKRIPFVAR